MIRKTLIKYYLSDKVFFLYEPLFKYNKIKYHKYVVEMNLLVNQYSMIYNEEQYF